MFDISAALDRQIAEMGGNRPTVLFIEPEDTGGGVFFAQLRPAGIPRLEGRGGPHDRDGTGEHGPGADRIPACRERLLPDR